MRVGTPGFVGARLREAREARGLSGSMLADLLGVTRQAVSQFEIGEKSPTPDTLRRITEVLNLPQPFFLRPAHEDRAGTVFFRSRMSATKGARTKARKRRVWLGEVAAFVAQHIELPPVDFPPCDFPADPWKITAESIERAATATRRYWGLKDGPISDVSLLLENHGSVLVREPFDEAKLDAYSTWVDGVPYVILNEDKQSAVRSRFDLAHELGHLILHRNVDDVRLEERKADHKLTEAQADLFAGMFLLPRETFTEDFILPTLDALLALKPRWKVSVGAMLMQAKQYDLMSPEQAERLWAAYGRRKWRTREPLDDDLPPERPRVLRLAFELALGEKVFNGDDVLAALALSANDVETLIGLPRGTLGAQDPVVRVLTFPQDRTSGRARSADTTPADIVPFRRDNRPKERL